MFETGKMTDAEARNALDYLELAIEELERGNVDKALSLLYKCEFTFPTNL
jgi:hypothetical protein